MITKHSGKNVDILKAKSVELENRKMHKVYEEVENKGQSFTSVRWVITQKYKGECMYYKARLVARGFEESNLIDICKDSPTCCKENFRLLQAIVVTNKWKVNTLDIKFAFLQGNEIDCEVYLKPPSEAGTNSL